jgi:hypothetical protein
MPDQNTINCTGLGSLWGPAGYEIVLHTGKDKKGPPAPAKITVQPTSTSAEISWPESRGATG